MCAADLVLGTCRSFVCCSGCGLVVLLAVLWRIPSSLLVLNLRGVLPFLGQTRRR